MDGCLKLKLILMTWMMVFRGDPQLAEIKVMSSID
jgi:hypothetical protein